MSLARGWRNNHGFDLACIAPWYHKSYNPGELRRIDPSEIAPGRATRDVRQLSMDSVYQPQ